MNKTATAQQTQTLVNSSHAKGQGMLQRKCACGSHTLADGECPSCAAKKKIGLQRKLKIGASNNPLEREADRVADQVMAMPLNSSINATPPRIQRFSGQTNDGLTTAPASVDRVLASSGRPLEPGLRQDMESRFGYDFSQVRVHTNKDATDSAKLVNARAYTFGQNIVFGDGEYVLGERGSESLLAHELVHVIQQKGGYGGSNYQIMRTPLFNSTIHICNQYLRSRIFHITEDGLRVTLNARWEVEGDDGPMPGGCRPDRNFSIELRDDGLLFFDFPWGTCDFTAGEISSRQWTNLPPGDYYLAINTPYTGPDCCLTGDIEVAQGGGLEGSTCTEPPPGPLEILHNALSVAGLLPALGVIPDAIDTGIYLIEGDWTNSAISAAAMVPIFGQGAAVTRLGVRVSGESVLRLGRDGVERAIREGVERAGTRVLRIAPPERIIVALRNFHSRTFRAGSETFLLDSSGMRHILERHHPFYWNGSVRQSQSFFADHLSVDDVADAINAVMSQNREQLIRLGTTGQGQISGVWGGVTYILGVNRGRVGQFFPL